MVKKETEKIDCLTYSKIYDPAPVERSRRILISDYPFFTADVRYDEKLLASKTYSEILNIFFDKQQFVKIILSDSTATPSPTTSQLENANANIMTMLKLLFPTSYPIKDNLNTSFKKYLLKKPNKYLHGNQKQNCFRIYIFVANKRI